MIPSGNVSSCFNKFNRKICEIKIKFRFFYNFSKIFLYFSLKIKKINLILNKFSLNCSRIFRVALIEANRKLIKYEAPSVDVWKFSFYSSKLFSTIIWHKLTLVLVPNIIIWKFSTPSIEKCSNFLSIFCF